MAMCSKKRRRRGSPIAPVGDAATRGGIVRCRLTDTVRLQAAPCESFSAARHRISPTVN